MPRYYKRGDCVVRALCARSECGEDYADDSGVECAPQQEAHRDELEERRHKGEDDGAEYHRHGARAAVDGAAEAAGPLLEVVLGVETKNVLEHLQLDATGGGLRHGGEAHCRVGRKAGQ